MYKFDIYIFGILRWFVDSIFVWKFLSGDFVRAIAIEVRQGILGTHGRGWAGNIGHI